MSLRIRRGGGASPSGGGGGSVYGPTDGRDAVVAGVGPRTVGSPGGGTSFNSSASLQAAINAAGGVATSFVCSVNTPTWNSSVNCGTVGHTIILPGPVGQKVVDAGGLELIGLQGRYTLKGGTWRNFGTTSFGHGAIPDDDSVIEDAVFETCHFSGISVVGHRVRISYCRLQNNGSAGATTGTTGVNQANDVVLEYCEVSGNNADLNAPGSSASGEGVKFLFVGRGWWHHNYFHGNFGPGLWPDTNNWACVIEENVCEDNYWAGLFMEASYGNTVRHNYIKNNGRNTVIGGAVATFDNVANVRLSDNAASRIAPDGTAYPMDFSFNYIDHDLAPAGQTGGLLTLLDHTDTASRHVSNHNIHDNQWWIRNTNSIGGDVSRIRPEDNDVVTPITTTFQLWNLNNTFSGNEYHVPAASLGTAWWQWDIGAGTGVPKTYTQWQAIHPGETKALVPI